MKYTKEELQNTYGEVQSLEHAEFIVELGKNANAEISTEYSKGSFFNFYTGPNGELYLGFFDKHLAKDSGEKQITIPLPPRESVIEWKESAVCFAGGSQFKTWDINRGELITVDNVSVLDFETVLSFKDFQLNTIKQGDYILKSEIDTEDKYNRAAEVFGLFGFERKDKLAIKNLSDTRFVADLDFTFCGTDFSDEDCKREITFNQLMAIGELKRLELKGGNATLSSDEETELKSRAMASELNSQSNDDEWPKIGDKAAHPVCGLCTVMSLADSNGVVAALNESGFNVLVFKSDLSKPKTPEDLLIEELQTKLVKNNAVDNWMLAANIISGDIEGLTYKSDIESAVKSVINKNLDGDL